MAIRVNRADLLQVLARLEPGRSKREFIAQSSCFVFAQGWATTFNDEVCIRAKSGLPKDFFGAVFGKPFKDVLENMTDEEVDLEQQGNELHIRGRRKRAAVRMEGEILLPYDQISVPDKDSWSEIANPAEYSAALRQVCGVAGTDEEEFLAVCVRLEPGFLEATDRWQATRYEMDTGVTAPCMVRAKSLLPVTGLDVTKVGVTDDWLHYRNGSVLYSTRRHLGDYFPLEPLFQFRGTPAVLPRGAAEAAKLGAVFSSEDAENNKVTVRLTDGHMVVRGEGAFGWAEADLEMSYRGEPRAFRIAPETLEALVEKHTDVEIGSGKLLVSGERWKYVTVLGAPDGPPPAQTESAEPEPQEVSADD